MRDIPADCMPTVTSWVWFQLKGKLTAGRDHVQYKTAEVAARCKCLMRVNIYKNRVKLSTALPILPNREALQVQLMPSYYTLGSIGRDKARSRPLYSITDDQRHAAEEFLRVSPEHDAPRPASAGQHIMAHASMQAVRCCDNRS